MIIFFVKTEYFPCIKLRIIFYILTKPWIMSKSAWILFTGLGNLKDSRVYLEVGFFLNLFSVAFSIYRRLRSHQKYSITANSGQELSNRHFLTLTDVKSIQPDTETMTDHLHSHRNPLRRMGVPLGQLHSQEVFLCETDFKEDTFPVTTFISSLESTVIYPHNLYILTYNHTITLLRNVLPWVSLEPCIWWERVKKNKLQSSSNRILLYQLQNYRYTYSQKRELW